MSHSSQDLPPDLLAAARAVEEQAPRLTEPELARIKRRVAGPSSRGRARAGRTRIAIVALLATGGLLTSGGAALGVSALSTDLTARSAQYGPGAQSTGTLGSGVLGTSAQGGSEQGPQGGSEGQAAQEGASGVAGASAAGAAANGEELAEAQAQRPRQLTVAAGDELPFTGWAAIPMLLAGIALLASGLVARSRSRGAPAQP